MDISRAKAIQTRLKNLRAKFEAEHGREPSVTELDLLYREDMQRIANMSSRNNKGTGGFAYMKKTDPARLKEITSKGGSRTKYEKESEGES
jgi:short-subunit dehydrogenase